MYFLLTFTTVDFPLIWSICFNIFLHNSPTSIMLQIIDHRHILLFIAHRIVMRAYYNKDVTLFLPLPSWKCYVTFEQSLDVLCGIFPCLKPMIILYYGYYQT